MLIIQTAFIGDAILASCLLEKLHHEFPQAKLSILVRKGNEGIYRDHPYLHEVLVWNKKEQKLANLWRLLRKIRGAKYDCIINCHRHASSGLLTAFSGAKHTAGFKQNPFSFLFNYSIKHRFAAGLHETQRYHDLLADFCSPERFPPRLYPSEKDKQVIQPLLKGEFVCIAPASVWFTKQLPAEKWVELIKALPAEQQVYLLGAKSDQELCNTIIKNSGRINIKALCG